MRPRPPIETPKRKREVDQSCERSRRNRCGVVFRDAAGGPSIAAATSHVVEEQPEKGQVSGAASAEHLLASSKRGDNKQGVRPRKLPREAMVVLRGRNEQRRVRTSAEFEAGLALLARRSLATGKAAVWPDTLSHWPNGLVNKLSGVSPSCSRDDTGWNTHL